MTELENAYSRLKRAIGWDLESYPLDLGKIISDVNTWLNYNSKSNALDMPRWIAETLADTSVFKGEESTVLDFIVSTNIYTQRTGNKLHLRLRNDRRDEGLSAYYDKSIDDINSAYDKARQDRCGYGRHPFKVGDVVRLRCATAWEMVVTEPGYEELPDGHVMCVWLSRSGLRQLGHFHPATIEHVEDMAETLLDRERRNQ